MANDSAQIYKKGQLAAELYKSGNTLVFKYREDYLASNGAGIATTLPKSELPISLPGGSSPAFFAGLLPEGRRLNAIRRRIKASADNDLALLLEIGQDLIGDVQVLPEERDQRPDRDTLKLPANTDQLNFTKIRDEYFGHQASGLPGVQDKVSGKMLNARSKIVNRDYIIKFNPDEAPFAVENEAYFLGLAKKCDIPTATYKVLTDSLGNHALSLERFDRIPTDSGNLRQAQEDGCQVMDLYPADKYDPDFVEMAERLISLCPAKGIAGYNLFKQLVFSWLIGNGDAHAKNFSILESPSGEWMISPAYDLLCTAYYQNDREMALSIEELTTKWTRELLLRTAKRLYVPERAAKSVIDRQLNILASLSDDIVNKALPFPSHLNFDVAKLLKKRFASLTE